MAGIYPIGQALRHHVDRAFKQHLNKQINWGSQCAAAGSW